MREQNRFGILLKQLMSVAQVKNYTLAKDLQYDESYISKWVNGSSLPTERNYEKVIRSISKCIIENLDESGWEDMMQTYQLTRRNDLVRAVYDNLIAEYRYCQDLKESTGSEIAPRISLYPELSLAQLMSKMLHPAVRQVRSLDVIFATDILSLDRQYQLSLTQSSGDTSIATRNFPSVRSALLIHLHGHNEEDDQKVILMLNLLTCMADVNYHLYLCPQVVGKLMFAIKDAFVLSGMIIDKNHCIAVTTSEDPQICNAIYDRLKSLCTPENELLRHTTMEEMISSNAYTQYLLARNQRWLLGHLTEHFVPPALFEELAEIFCTDNPMADPVALHNTYHLTQILLESLPLKILVYENLLTNFAISGELDFFNRKILLTLDQRLLCLEHIRTWIQKNDLIQVRLARDSIISHSAQSPNPTLFLSDTVCYLRLSRCGDWNKVGILTQEEPTDMFRSFFDHTWDSKRTGHSYAQTNIDDMIQYVIRMVNVQRNVPRE